MRNSFDVIILGTGMAGLGTARGLIKRGKKVLLIGRRDLRGAASRLAAGMLNPYLGIEPGNPLLPHAIQALKDFPGWVSELESVSGVSVGYEKTGLLYLARNARERAKLEKSFAWQKKQEVRVEWLERAALIQSYPDLSGQVEAGVFFPDMGRVKAASFMQAFETYIKQKGGVTALVDAAPELRRTGEGCEVKAGKNTYYARQVVNACGAWSSLAPAGLKARQVRPARGQIFVLKESSLRIPTIVHTLDDGYMVPWGSGVYLCGSTLEFVGYRPQTTQAGEKRVLREIESVVPAIRGAECIDSWGGLRPMGPKRLPEIQPKSKEKDFFVTTGFFRSGILLGAYLGDLTAAGMSEKNWPKELKPFCS